MIKCADFNQYKEDIESGVKNLTKDGKCSQCGSCCSNMLPLTPTDIKRVKRYIKKHKIKERKHLYPYAGPVLDMTCPFLDDSKETTKCMIYEARPEICRDFFCGAVQPVPLSDYMGHFSDLKFCNVREEFYGGKNDK